MIGCVIQARLGSTRFPRKMLAPVDGKALLARTWERAAAIPGVDIMVLAVPADEPELAEWGLAHLTDAVVLKGHPTDVLSRYAAAATLFDLDPIVRVTGDCPLVCPDAGGEVLESFLTARQAGITYTANTGFSTESANNVDGLDVQVFSRAVLCEAHAKATDPYDREHVTPWIVRKGLCSCVNGHGVGRKLSVDRPEDLHDIDLIFETARSLAYTPLFGLGDLRRILFALNGLLRNEVLG